MTEKRESSSNKLEEEVELRRGPWTLEEDTLLIHYIACHGEGRWNLLARCSGLKRTGKSCRLRWLNYLKPDIKRGNLSPEEQLLILELHSKWGNRWSRIAQHLPGRTDNEIKNYWRTRVQKQARQLKIDANSAVFRDAIRCYWLPRLLERMGSPAAVQSLFSTNAHHYGALTPDCTMTAAAVAHHDQPPCHQALHVAINDYPLSSHHPSLQYGRLMENCSSSYNFSPCMPSGMTVAAALAPSEVHQATNACEFSSSSHDRERKGLAFSSYDDGGYPGVDNAYNLGSWDDMAPASAPLTLGYDSTSDYTTSACNNCATTNNVSTVDGPLWSMDELYGMFKGYMNDVESAASFWC